MKIGLSLFAVLTVALIVGFFLKQSNLPHIDPACRPYLCKDGTTFARCTEDGHPINYFAPPCLTNGGEVTESGVSSCDEFKSIFDTAVTRNQSCESNTDCVLFSFSCPYVTCGIAVNPSALNELQQHAEAFTECLEESGKPVSCAGCVEMKPQCEGGRCITE